MSDPRALAAALMQNRGTGVSLPTQTGLNQFAVDEGAQPMMPMAAQPQLAPGATGLSTRPMMPAGVMPEMGMQPQATDALQQLVKAYMDLGLSPQEALVRAQAAMARGRR